MSSGPHDKAIQPSRFEINLGPRMSYYTFYVAVMKRVYIWSVAQQEGTVEIALPSFRASWTTSVVIGAKDPKLWFLASVTL